MKRLRGAAFDLGVGLVLAAAVSSAVLFVAAPIYSAARRALKMIGVM